MRVAIDGEALRRLRKLRGCTTSALARAAGVTPAAVCHLERGRRATVSAGVFALLVRELDIETRPDWIRPVAAPEGDSTSTTETTDAVAPAA